MNKEEQDKLDKELREQIKSDIKGKTLDEFADYVIKFSISSEKLIAIICAEICDQHRGMLSIGDTIRKTFDIKDSIKNKSKKGNLKLV